MIGIIRVVILVIILVIIRVVILVIIRVIILVTMPDELSIVSATNETLQSFLLFSLRQQARQS